MLQKFLTYFFSIIALFAMIYLVFFIWWLFLPFFLVLLGFTMWRVHQARKMWNDLLKQSQNTQKTHTHYRKVTDDNVIDVDYEEIKQ